MSGAAPHAGARIVTDGAPLSRARLALVMAHGRGGSAEDMLALAKHLGVPDVAALAPQAAGRSWWPDSFLAPLAHNEPYLSSALSVLDAVIERLGDEGFGPERIVIAGFSQGACLALEHAARAGRPYRAVHAMSGGLIGTSDTDEPASEALYGRAPKRFDYAHRLDGVPVHLSCHENDPHIPLARVRASEEVFRSLGADVSLRVDPGAGHAVMAEDLAALRATLNVA